jgi:hypothetical protein
LARIASKASSIDFVTIGHAASSEIISEYSPDNSLIALSDASEFPDTGKAYINDKSGNTIINWTGKKENILTGVTGIKGSLQEGAILINKDDLQEIKGIGPFIEEKLNALGIFTFRQISNMDEEIENQVNVAIEFFLGRIKRDEWAKQAYDFIK